MTFTMNLKIKSPKTGGEQSIFIQSAKELKEEQNAEKKEISKSTGRLVFESGYSSISNFETGSAELVKIYEIMRETEGYINRTV